VMEAAADFQKMLIDAIAAVEASRPKRDVRREVAA
jgi:hypothetical protein